MVIGRATYQRKSGNLAMNSLWTGSTWLLTTAAALGPLIALLIGFAGTDRLLRWQLAEKRDHTSLKGAEGSGD